MNEKKAVGSSYIFNFFMEVNKLTQSYANYMNLVSEFEHKYPRDKIEQSGEGEKQVVNQYLQNTKFLVHTSFIMFRSINSILKIENEKITGMYDQLSKAYVLDRKKLREFVEEMNTVLLQGVIQEILVSNQDLLSQIYGNEHNNQPEQPTSN